MKNWLHITGISGKITSKIALLFKEKGWFVTGSDIQFFPPASTVLEENKIPTKEGYSYKNLTKEFWEEKLSTKLDIPVHPTRAIIVESATHKNKEFLFAKKNNIQMQPYSQVLGEVLVKEESIVVVGTAGKTTTTGLITHVLNELGLNPSFMVGGDVLSLDSFIKDTNSDFSVMEGDEYHNPNFSNGAKFLEYKPKYLVITNIGWEHQDIFPTKESYIAEFKKIISLLPKNGLIVAKAGDENIDSILENAPCKVIRFGFEKENQAYINLENREYSINYESKIIKGEMNLVGNFNALNYAAAVLLFSNIKKIKENFKLTELVEAANSYRGVKKRMEILYDSEKIVVIDDFAPAPNRVENSLQSIKESYPNHYVVAIFEPNSGSRVKDPSSFTEMYENTFSLANEVLVPELSDYNSDLLSSIELSEGIRSLHPHIKVRTMEVDTLLESLEQIKNKQNKLVVVFYSSYRLEKVQIKFVENM